MDDQALRKLMVQEQLIARGIKNPAVIDAFYKVPRHNFVSPELRVSAYSDYPLPIQQEQTISQPYIVALMTELLDLRPEHRVLEIGTGSGYQTAILAELAGEIFSVERFALLAESAKCVLNSLGYNNINIKVGDGSLGWAEEGPFDRIIITAASPMIPLPLTEQLKDGGIMILPLGQELNQMLTLAKKSSGLLENTPICGCAFVPLVGRYANKPTD